MGQAILDEALLNRLRAGDAAARDEFLALYQPRIFSFGMMVCGHREDAEDIAQDAILQALGAITGLRSPEAFSVWLFRIVKNACHRQRRRQRVGNGQPLELEEAQAAELPDPSTQAQPEAAAIRLQTQQLIRTAIDALPPEDRLLLLLRDFEELPVAEVAEVMGLGESAVKMRLLRVRRKLRDRLQPQFASVRQALRESKTANQETGSGAIFDSRR